MTQRTDTRTKNLVRRRWLATMLALILISSVRVAGYSTAKLEPTPTSASSLAASNDQGPVTAAADSSLAPFLDIVPLQDGTGLFISAGGTGELGGTVYANIGIGPGCDKGSYTMVYSGTVQAYVTTAAGLTPSMDAYAPLSITTTLGLDTGAVDFYRAHVPASTSQIINSVDGNLQLTLVSTDTFPSEAYVVVVPSYALPGPLPPGHRQVGSTYSVRASGAILVSDRPMSLRLYYEDATLAGADPHALSIFAWDAYRERWDELGGTLFPTQQFVSVVTSRFTTYALMATRTWRDEFSDFSGLSFPGETHHVTVRPIQDNLNLVLQETATSGVAVSKPITPTTAFANWGSLSFTYTVDPPTTTLTVDVLRLDGTEVMTGVSSGVDLTALNAKGYPALKLRANLSSTMAGQTPALDWWRLTWEVPKIFVPVVLR